VEGTITRLTKFGAFARLEGDVEGLIHISEMSWSQHIKHPSQLLHVGMEVEAKVLNVEMDEKKIYCSELVYKAYLLGAGVEIGKKEVLGSLNWKGHEDFIRYITGGDLPLDRVMVTSDSLSTSPRVRLVYTSFPPKSGEPLYSTIDLAGTWSGDYTIMDLGRATAVLKFRPDTRKPDNQAVILQSGYIGYGGSKIEINSFSIDTFRNAREFTAEITDARGIKAKISAKIKDRGTRLLGTWKDSRGNSGVFSLEKISR